VTVLARRPVTVAVASAVALAIVLIAVQRATAQTAAAPDDDVARGASLYLTGCVSCHGVNGGGTNQAPSLIGVGAASAHFWLSTGRMPAAQGQPYQSARKRPAYNQADIGALVAYVASLGPGPPIPEVNVAGANLANGGLLYRANCASCHQSAGAGGALSYGQSAPSLGQATAVQVVEAMRTGPGQMPVFGEGTVDDAAANDIAAYVQYLRDPDDPGGLALGGNGPVPEGLVALVVGLGGLVALSVWIVGRRAHE
jgi:ubiquinol-cytochrome c reductase cytochrome c subunit